MDFGNWTLATGLEIGRFLGELGEFWAAIGRCLDFFNFHHSNLLDKRMEIGRILDNWEGLMVNWKIQNPNTIGNWTLEN